MCGHWTSNIKITKELVRNAILIQSYWIRSSRSRTQSALTSPAGDFYTQWSLKALILEVHKYGNKSYLFSLSCLEPIIWWSLAHWANHAHNTGMAAQQSHPLIPASLPCTPRTFMCNPKAEGRLASSANSQTTYKSLFSQWEKKIEVSFSPKGWAFLIITIPPTGTGWQFLVHKAPANTICNLAAPITSWGRFSTPPNTLQRRKLKLREFWVTSD